VALRTFWRGLLNVLEIVPAAGVVHDAKDGSAILGEDSGDRRDPWFHGLSCWALVDIDFVCFGGLRFRPPR
jgi:hypothetical protein